MLNENTPFFCYGTLRAGFGNYNRLLKGKTVAEVPATVEGTLFAVGQYGGFPCYIEGGETAIVGELMYVPDEIYTKVRQSLDSLEGYRELFPESSMYLRKMKTVKTAAGDEVLAWVYVWNSSVNGKPLIESGDFTKFREPVAPFEPTCEDCGESLGDCRCDDDLNLCDECGKHYVFCDCDFDGEDEE